LVSVKPSWLVACGGCYSERIEGILPYNGRNMAMLTMKDFIVRKRPNINCCQRPELIVIHVIMLPPAKKSCGILIQVYYSTI
jgi:hypothetical protein